MKSATATFRDLFSDDGPSLNTFCDSFRSFIAVSRTPRGASKKGFFCSVISSCFALLSLLRPAKSHGRVSNSVDSVPLSPDNFFHYYSGKKTFLKELLIYPLLL